MADYTPTRPFDEQLTSTGAQNRFYKMFGDAGAAANGVSEWKLVENIQKMTFMIYPSGDQALAIAAAVVDVEGAMELDADAPDTETKAAVLGTLTDANKVLTVDDNVRYVRVRMTTAAANPAQVGLKAVGF